LPYAADEAMSRERKRPMRASDPSVSTVSHAWLQVVEMPASTSRRDLDGFTARDSNPGSTQCLSK
jgi:hypothetical protein